MQLSSKQIKQIKKSYPGRSPEQIAAELDVAVSEVYQTLGLAAQMWDSRLLGVSGILMCGVLLFAPFVFIKGLSNFADMPQRYFIQLCMFFMALVWAVRRCIAGRVIISSNLVDILAALFIVWSLVQLLWSNNHYEGLYAALHWSACGLAYFFTVMCAEQAGWLRRFCAVIILAGAGVVLLGLCQQLFGLQVVPLRESPAAVFANPNMAAQYLAITLPVLTAAAFLTHKTIRRMSAVALVLCSLVFLYYTHCRAAWLAVLVAAGSAVMLLAVVRRQHWRVYAGYTALLACILCAGFYFLAAGRPDKIGKMFGPSAVYRVTIWKNSFDMVLDRPVTGFGPGSFKLQYPRYTYSREFDRAFDKTKQIRRAHNDYVQMTVELGLPGMLLFVFLFMSAFYPAVKIIRAGSSRSEQAIAAGLLCGIVSLGVTAFFSFPFQRSMPPLLLFVYLGMLSGMYTRQRPGRASMQRSFPRPAAAALAAVVLVCGAFYARYAVKDLYCEKYFYSAMRMERTGRNEPALQNALKAISYNENRMDVLTTAGRAHITTGRLDRGIEVLERVVSRQPYNLNALFILGAAYANAGMNDKALEVFDRVLHIKPDFEEAQHIIALIKSRGRVKINLS